MFSGLGAFFRFCPFVRKAVWNTAGQRRASLKPFHSSKGQDVHFSWTQSARHSSHHSIYALWSSWAVWMAGTLRLYLSPQLPGGRWVLIPFLSVLEQSCQAEKETRPGQTGDNDCTPTSSWRCTLKHSPEGNKTSRENENNKALIWYLRISVTK